MLQSRKFNFKVSSLQHYLCRFSAQLLMLTLLLSLCDSVAGKTPDTSRVEGKKQISEMNLLLPVSQCENQNSPECRTVKYELAASNGCYEWSISHPHLLGMTPANQRGQCVDSVTLEPLINRDSKTLIWITAKDKNSGQLLESQVKLGKIERIAINVNYKHFYVNDKKHVDLVAFDDEGNIFSGLEGFRFDWSIQTGAQHMKIIPKPEGYDHPSQGTEVTFVRGLQAGSAELKVKILEPFYDKQIASTSITFMVVDPFIVEPSQAIFILPTSVFKLSLAKLKKSDTGVVTREKISIPNKQYLWSIADENIGTISQDGTFVSRITEGKQVIFVVDQQMTNNTSEGQLNVVFPYKIQMSLKDITEKNDAALALKDGAHEFYFTSLYGDKNQEAADSLILVEDRLYLVQLTLQDKDGNTIKLTENIRFESEGLFSSDSIKKLKVNHIGSDIIFKTSQITSDQLKIPTTYRLSKIIPAKDELYSLEGKELLKIDAEFILTKPVEIVNPTNLILLPFLPNGQTWQISAKGGSGVYTWSVANPAIASVEGSAVVRSLKTGKTKLQLQDHRNKQNTAFIDIEVATVNQLKWLEDHLELQSQENATAFSGESTRISLIALDRLGRKFTNCTSLDTSFEIKGEGNLIKVQTKFDYQSIKTYISSAEVAPLLSLRQKFDENSSKQYLTDLPEGAPLLKTLLMLHNNFGICSQTAIKAELEGLGRVKASSKILLESGNHQTLESEFAEVAIYKQLSTSLPVISTAYTHLYSRSQVGQEFVNFDSFFVKDLITLLPGTETEWTIVGGSNFWQDYQGKYSVNWHVDARQPTANTNAITLSKFTESVTKLQMKLLCVATPDFNQINRLRVSLIQTTRQSRQLLRPAQHRIQLNVNCGSAKSAKLLWTQPTEQVTLDLPNSRLVQDERTHFVLTGSKHFVETLFLDDQQNSYFNSSSVVTSVIATDTQLASVTMTDKNFTVAVKNSRQAKREVQFTNNTGRLQIKTISSGYQKQMLNLESTSYFNSEQKDSSVWNLGPVSPLPAPLTDSINIEVVKNVEVEPKFKQLYIGSKSEYKLTIKEGSGHFAITINDLELAQVTHKEREIFVLPKEPGQLLITIEDLLVPGAEKRNAQILISDIEKLFIWSPQTLIEQGNEMSLSVTAIDSQNNEFELDQYTDMRFEIETEMTTMNKELGLKTEATKINTDFKAIGNQPGIYQLTAFSNRIKPAIGGQMTVYSEMLKIEVFPLLEIFPAELLLTPGMRYTLQINGGPQSSILSFQNGSSVEIKFEIDDSKIASVDLNREVTAHQVGNATLKYLIIQQRGQRANPYRSGQVDQIESGVVSKKQVPIRVRLITEVEIPQNHKRLIYTGTLIKMNVVLKFGQEYFTSGIAPISYAWNCTQSGVLILELPSQGDSLPTGTTNSFIQKSRKMRNNSKNDDGYIFSSLFNSSSIYATAGKEGDAPVQVTLAIEYPGMYKNDQNIFVTSATLKVASRLAVQVNKDSTSSQESFTMFLLPPNSVGHIKANLNTKLKLGFSIVSVYDRSTGTHRSEEATTPLVKLIDNKAIQTFDKYGKVTVVIEQGGQAFSDQIAMLNVFISDIFSLQVMNSYDALNMPLGSVLKLPIHFQNEHASRFADSIDGPRIAFSLSHPKVVSVEIDSFAQTLTMTSQGQGDCIILIYLESNPRIFDVVRVRVSSIVRPLSPVILHVGGVVNYKVINPDEGHSEFQKLDQGAQWFSSDSNILTVDSETGRAFGKIEGRTEVILSNHVNAASLVHVSRIQFGQIEHKGSPLVLNTDEKSTTNSNGYDVLRVRVKLFFTKDGEEVMPILQYSGITLVQQNVGLNCATNQSDYVSVTSEVSDIEGYFCVMSYKKNSNHRSLPRFVKIVASAFGLQEGSQQLIYSTDVAQFEVQLLSTIRIESKFKSGVKLGGSQRSESVHVFSSSEFQSRVDSNDEDASDLLKLKVSREDQNSNDYTLTLIVPPEVDYDFEAAVVLTHPFTKVERVIPVNFVYANQKEKQTKKVSTKQTEPEYEEMPKVTKKAEHKKSWGYGNHLVMFLVVVFTVAFIAHNWLGFNVTGLFAREGRDERPQRPPSRRLYGMNDGSGIREPQRQQSFPAKNYSQSSFYNGQSNAEAQPRQGININEFDRNRRSVAAQNSGIDRSRLSIYSNSSPYN